MADSTHIIPFILSAEGGYSNNPADQGGETNKGITYSTWKQYFGDTHDRFMAMSYADWSYIFINGYWNEIKGDQINSQTIANFMADWYWNSGTWAVKHLQSILGVNADGQIGPITLAAINASDPQTLYDDLIAARDQFYHDIVANDPTQSRFLQGWLNRVNNFLAAFPSAVIDAVTNNPGISVVTLFFCLVSALSFIRM